MGKKLSTLLVNQLVFNHQLIGYSEWEWELLLRQARAAGVLSRLAIFWKEFCLYEPTDFVIAHLISAEKFWLSQKRIVDWEIFCLQKIFSQLQVPLILLKGAAYSASSLHAGMGRVFNDIDVLVPKSRLQDVVDKLKWAGWYPEKIDDYDRNYYEQWMHELPPMRHIQRGTTLDLHHNIIPETCSLCPDAGLLLDMAVKMPNSEYWVLAPEDMVLHSASHLFFGGEFDNGIRDLSDIDLLLREFSNDNPMFFKSLLERAKFLGMVQPLFYALRYSNKLLLTPLPEEIVEAYSDKKVIGINIHFMDMLFLSALMPNHPSCNSSWSRVARWLLYVRSHWLKMPWYLLIPHLSRKAWMRVTGSHQH